MNLETLWYLGGLPFIIALVQVGKIWIADSRVYPVLAVALGLVFDLGIGTLIGKTWIESLIAGAIVGLTASGLYSGSQTLKQ